MTPLTLPSPTDFTAGGLASVSTAPMPVCAPPTAMLTLPAAAVQGTMPGTFWSLPSMVTFAAAVPLEPAAAALVALEDDPPPLVVDLLLEHPERPTTTIAVADAATVTERFTRAPLPLWRSTGTSQTAWAVCSFTEPPVSNSPKIRLPANAAIVLQRKFAGGLPIGCFCSCAAELMAVSGGWNINARVAGYRWKTRRISPTPTGDSSVR